MLKLTKRSMDKVGFVTEKTRCAMNTREETWPILCNFYFLFFCGLLSHLAKIAVPVTICMLNERCLIISML